ncbi:unnamed protein product, partial [Prunus brigantina]
GSDPRPRLSKLAPLPVSFSHHLRTHTPPPPPPPPPFSLQSLKSLPFGAKISTLLSDNSLSFTTLAYDPRVSLNNVPITVSLIFDDGSLIIFGIDRFLECAEVEGCSVMASLLDDCVCSI